MRKWKDWEHGHKVCSVSYSLAFRLWLSLLVFLLHLSVAATPELSKAAIFARENRQAIAARFADFQTKVCDKLSKNGVNIEQFRLFVKNQFHPGDCIPPRPASLTEMFEAITHHGLWNYFHYSPLVRITEKFGANDSEMKSWVQTYKNDLKAYQLVTTVEDYIETHLDNVDAPPAKRAKHDPRYYFQWNGKPNSLTTLCNTLLMCGKSSPPTTSCQTPHQQPCLIVFVRAVFQWHGLFHQPWFRHLSREQKLTLTFSRNIVF